MFGRIAAALCLAAFFATSGPWMNGAWSALMAAFEETGSPPIEKPKGGDEGWLVDPNG